MYIIIFVTYVLIVTLVESAVRKESNVVKYIKAEQENEIVGFERLFCPKEYHRLPIFAYKCEVDEDCKGFGKLCCREKNWKICREGASKKRKEPKHARIPRMCPSSEAIIEVLPVQTCKVDKDCTPRICCPDGLYSYCRTAVPHIGTKFYPRIMRSFKAMMSYLQCSSPPPPLLDFFPKPCKNSFDCFPNLCCQEKGQKVCRPPKRSLLTSLSTLT